MVTKKKSPLKKKKEQHVGPPKAPKQIRLNTQRRSQDQRNGITTNKKIDFYFSGKHFTKEN